MIKLQKTVTSILLDSLSLDFSICTLVKQAAMLERCT